jgi:hypothetical protein
MRLTAETFTELVRSLRSNAPGASEKRRAPRVGLRARADIIVRAGALGLAEQIPVGIRDISASGMGLTCARPLMPGATFMLVLDGDGVTRDTNCTVVHCREMGEGFYRIGAQFDSVE